jgi:chromosome segregation ATPase
VPEVDCGELEQKRDAAVEAWDTYYGQKQDAIDEYNAAVRTLDDADGALNTAQEERRALSETLDQDERAHARLEESKSPIETELEAARTRLEGLQRTRDDLQRLIEDQADDGARLDDAQRRKWALEDRLVEIDVDDEPVLHNRLSNEYIDLLVKMEALELEMAQRQELIDTIESEYGDVDALEQLVEEARDEVETLEGQIAAIERQQEELDLDDTRASLAEEQATEEAARGEFQTAETAVWDLSAKMEEVLGELAERGRQMQDTRREWQQKCESRRSTP